MKTTLLVCLLVAVLITMPFYAVVNQNTVVYDSVGHYGLMIRSGTIVRVLENDQTNCLIQWDKHKASILCSYLTRYSYK